MPSITTVSGQRIAAATSHVKRIPDTRFIRKALIDRGWSITRLARAVKMTRPHVSGVVHGRYRGGLAQERIAKALGLGIEQAFPRKKEKGR